MSLLLESLKKAALEKQKKEKASGSVSEPEKQESFHENIDHKNSLVKNQEIDVEFNSDEFEFVVEHEAAVEEPVPIKNEQPAIEPAVTVDASIDKKLEQAVKSESEKNKTDHAEINSKVEKNNHEEIKVNPVKDSKLHSFTPESGKAALALLLEKNKKIEKSGKIRSIYMMVILLITGLGTLGGYYYFLMDDQSSIVSTNQMRLYTHENNTAVTETTITDPVEDTTNTNLPQVVESESVAVDNDEQQTLVDQPQLNNQPAAAPESVAQVQVQNPTTEKPAQKIQSVKSREQLEKVNSEPIESYIQSQPQMTDAIAQQVNEAYQAYQQGRWNEAQVLYQNVLMLDSHNRDALLGAAAVAVRQGKSQEALGYYQQQLERDPQDEYAISGIMALSLDTNKAGLLLEIDRRLQEKPASVHLLFLKGSLLAAQQQWGSAQEAFFEAWNYDKNNADIVYNLAICLDRLNQVPEAIRFYEMALSLKTPAANFSSSMIEKRLASLTRSMP